MGLRIRDAEMVASGTCDNNFDLLKLEEERIDNLLVEAYNKLATILNVFLN